MPKAFYNPKHSVITELTQEQDESSVMLASNSQMLRSSPPALLVEASSGDMNEVKRLTSTGKLSDQKEEAEIQVNPQVPQHHTVVSSTQSAVILCRMSAEVSSR